jgi:hypothetical protein
VPRSALEPFRARCGSRNTHSTIKVTTKPAAPIANSAARQPWWSATQPMAGVPMIPEAGSADWKMPTAWARFSRGK